MRRRTELQLVAVFITAVLGCAKPKVWVPPRIALQDYGIIGLVEFRSSPGYGSMATQQFVARLHAAQAGVPVQELGPLAQVLRSVGQESLGPEAVRAIGERYGVDVVVAGDLEILEPQPSFSLQSFTEADVSADIHGTLTARLYEAGSGATIWSDQVRGRRAVARLNVSAGRLPRVGVVDPQGEEARLVDWLVYRATDDFRGRWVRP